MSDDLVGQRLREERDKKNLTQVQVFNKTGINNKTLSGYENGVSRPDYESLRRLSELYGVSIDYLLGVEGRENSLEETEEENLRIVIANKLQKINSLEYLKDANEYIEFLENKFKKNHKT